MNTPGSAAVTIIVPGFDVAAYVPEALASLQAQSRGDWCAVLVDDGSTDATGELFERAAAQDARFRVIHHEGRRGLGAARNSGLTFVRTPFVGFLDADDVMLPHAVESLLTTIESSGSDVVVGAYVRLRPDGKGGYAPGAVQPWVSAATSPARRGATLQEHPEVTGNIVAWSKVSRTALWRAHGLRFPEGRLYEDQIVAQRLYTLARGIDTVPEPVVQWRERADGSSITQREAELAVLIDCIDGMRAGLAVLDAAEQPHAADARVRLMLQMDVPRLVRLAVGHPSEAYRRALGTFVRELAERMPALPDANEVSAALLW